jgi:hypothetical protein
MWLLFLIPCFTRSENRAFIEQASRGGTLEMSMMIRGRMNLRQDR